MSKKKEKDMEQNELVNENQEKEIESQFSVIDKRKVSEDSSATEDKAIEKKLPTYVEELQKNLENAEKQLQQYINSYKKFLDDQESYKLRVKKECEISLVRGKVNFIKDMLEVIDSLERCKESCGVPDSNLAVFKEGLKLITDQFYIKLKSHGIEKINPLGEKFDPSFHEAVSVRETTDQEIANCVVEVIDFGYKLSDRLIRPVKVVVGKLKDDVEEVDS